MSMAHGSRIPRPISKRVVLKRTPSAPSKLEELKAQFQERRCQERERQLGAKFQNCHQVDYMVEKNSETKPGLLRDFFHERRNTDNDSIQYRYNKPIYDDNKVIGYTHHPKLPYTKNSAGRDKSNPLAPIQKNTKPPSGGKCSKHSRGRHLHLTPDLGNSDGQMTAGTDSSGSVCDPLALPFQQKPTLVKGRHRFRHASGSSSSTDNRNVHDIQESLPLNTAQLHHIHERQRQIFSRRHSSNNVDQAAPHNHPCELLSHATLNSDSEDDVFLRGHSQQPSPWQPAQQPPVPSSTRLPAMTDFQKWQAEQDFNCKERIKKFRETQTLDDSDGGWDGQMVPTPPLNRHAQVERVKKERLRSMRRNVLDQQKKQQVITNDSDKENSTAGGGKGDKEGKGGREDTGMNEIQRKEHELMVRIQRGQEELEKMKQRRIEAHERKVAEENKKKREAAQKRLKMVSRATVREDLLDPSEADIPDHHTVKNKNRRDKDPSSEADIRDHHTVNDSQHDKDMSSNQKCNQAPPVKPAQKRLKMVSRATVREDLLDPCEADIPDHHTVKIVKNKSQPAKDVLSNQNYNQVPPVNPAPLSHPPPKRNVPAKKKASYQPEVDLDNEGTAFYANVASEAREAPAVDTVPCDLCGRRFAADRLARHSTICAKVSQKKRKVFDPAKMRAKGTDMEPYQRYAKHSAKKTNSHWRQKHKEFIESLQYARQVAAMQAKGGNILDLPPPPRTENPDYVACPYCERRFNKDAAERHIPRCKNIKSHPAPLKRHR